MSRVLRVGRLAPEEMTVTVDAKGLVVDVMDEIKRRSGMSLCQQRLFADGCALSPTRELASIESDTWHCLYNLWSGAVTLDCHLEKVELLHGTGVSTRLDKPCESVRPLWIGGPVTSVSFLFRTVSLATISASHGVDVHGLLMDSVAVNRNLSVREDDLGTLVPHRAAVATQVPGHPEQTWLEFRLTEPFSHGALRVFVNSNVLSSEFAVVRRAWQRRRWDRQVSGLLSSLLLPELAATVACYDDFEAWADEAGQTGSSTAFAGMRRFDSVRNGHFNIEDILGGLQLLVQVV